MIWKSKENSGFFFHLVYHRSLKTTICFFARKEYFNLQKKILKDFLQNNRESIIVRTEKGKGRLD
ncbi:MAG TPA: hypothetical protein DEP43_04665 [Ruminococcaceae bacterium]|nr:hypothetical protein [Oscillospiraceae bacterium]HCB65237.1 hypothetical protein [Oscillospiraceae bacterium]